MVQKNKEKQALPAFPFSPSLIQILWIEDQPVELRRRSVQQESTVGWREVFLRERRDDLDGSLSGIEAGKQGAPEICRSMDKDE